jgi:acyl-coenzyme A synthetase/AMP-(fatty) acid ligase
VVGSVASSCETWFEARPPSRGRAAPGYSITIVDERGRELPQRSRGQVAIRQADPRLRVEQSVGQPNLTSEFGQDWIPNGDVGFKDEDGYVWIEPDAGT